MIVLIVVIAALTIHYCFFILKAANGLKKLKINKQQVAYRPSITLIIPFRNEEKTIRENIESVNSLVYPDDRLEVIYIDDASEDNGPAMIRNLCRRNNFRVISSLGSENGRAYKKAAIQQAISNAGGEIIVLTDADTSFQPDWINSTIACFEQDTAMVSGPVTFVEEKNFFSKFQVLEFAGLNLMGAGLIGAGSPTICSAANLAFRKAVFLEVGGYKDIDDLSSGDDELLMQKIASQTKYKIKFNLDKKALVYTRSNSSFEEFKHQRIRWASKGLFYNKVLVAKLVAIFLFYILLLFSFIMSVIGYQQFLFTFIIMFFSKMIAEYQVLKKGSGIYFNKKLLRLIPFAELIQIPYIIIAPVLGLFTKIRWKGRVLEK